MGHTLLLNEPRSQPFGLVSLPFRIAFTTRITSRCRSRISIPLLRLQQRGDLHVPEVIAFLRGFERGGEVLLGLGERFGGAALSQ